MQGTPQGSKIFEQYSLIQGVGVDIDLAMQFGVHFFFLAQCVKLIELFIPSSGEAPLMSSMWHSFHTKTSDDHFTNPWFAQYKNHTEGYIKADGNTIRFSFLLHSEELMVFGTADAAKLLADQVVGELFGPELVGGKAVIYT